MYSYFPILNGEISLLREWVIIISKNKREFNADLDNYISRRNGENVSFFKKVDDVFSRNSSSKVPKMKYNETTIYDDGTKKNKNWFSIFSRKRKTSDIMEEEIQEHSAELSAEEKTELENMETEVSHIENEEEDLERAKGNVVSRFFASIFKKRSRVIEDDFDEVSEEHIQKAVQEDTLKDETRIVLKSMHKWLSRLPPDQIDAFRRSPEFEMYKELLGKYGLIK